MDNLSPLMAKSSSEVMSSHIQRLVQVRVAGCFLLLLSLCFTSTKRKKKDLQALKESLFILGRLLDLEKNETFKNKVAILTAEAKNDKERMATLEKSLQVEKDFCGLKDKQIGDLELKLLTVRAINI